MSSRSHQPSKYDCPDDHDAPDYPDDHDDHDAHIGRANHDADDSHDNLCESSRSHWLSKYQLSFHPSLC